MQYFIKTNEFTKSISTRINTKITVLAKLTVIDICDIKLDKKNDILVSIQSIDIHNNSDSGFQSFNVRKISTNIT